MSSPSQQISIADALQQALEHHRAGRLQQAEQLYRSILQAQPQHPDANHNLGVLAVQVNQAEKGLPHFKAALEAAPNEGRFWLSFIDALLRCGKAQEAAEAMKQGRARGLQGPAVDELARRLAQSAPPSAQSDAKGKSARKGKKGAKRKARKAGPHGKVSAAPLPSQEAVLHVANLFQIGDYGAAYEAAKRMTQDFSGHHFGFKVVAATLWLSGKPLEALPYAETSLSLLPEADTYNTYGAILKELGRHEEAVAACDKALALAPSLAEAHNNKGNALANLGRPEEALHAYDKALAAKPDYANAHNNRAGVLKELGRLEEALQASDRALELAPGLADAHNSRGNTLFALGRLPEALQAYGLALESKPDFADAHYNAGNVLQEQGRLDEALQAYDKALAIRPDYAAAWNNKGSVLKDQGRLDESAASCREAIRLKSDYAQAFANLVSIDPAAMDADGMCAMVEVEQSVASSEKEKEYASFALGRVYASRQEHDDAFRWIVRGHKHRCARMGHAYDHGACLRRLEQCRAVFHSGFFDAFKEQGSSSERPIFIVGFPRSGTSLLEQVLASHSRVFGAGELSDMGNLARPLFDEIVARGGDVQGVLSQARLQDLAQGYLRHLEGLAGESEHVVDKMPHNFEHLWLIALLFPQATVIHSRRAPEDTCLSCFFQDFTKGHAYTDDLVWLGQHYGYYEALMAHWREVLPLGMHEVVYEEFTSDPEAEIPRLLDACGLEFEPACLEFHRTSRTVKTASATQVRKKIYRSSVGKWRKYESHLGPLLREFDLARDAWGE